MRNVTFGTDERLFETARTRRRASDERHLGAATNQQAAVTGPLGLGGLDDRCPRLRRRARRLGATRFKRRPQRQRRKPATCSRWPAASGHRQRSPPGGRARRPGGLHGHRAGDRQRPRHPLAHCRRQRAQARTLARLTGAAKANLRPLDVDAFTAHLDHVRGAADAHPQPVITLTVEDLVAPPSA